MLKKIGVRKATLVSESAVEALPLGRTAALVPEFADKDLPLDTTLMMMMMMTNFMNYCIVYMIQNMGLERVYIKGH